jgi:hypothetical protein
LRKRALIAASAAVWAVILVAAGSGFGYPGGNGDASQEYDSGGSCHGTQGSGSITGTASTLSPTVGQSITVTITVTANELSSLNKVGVFLVRALQTSNSKPDVDGWVILSDPNGHQFNYVEKTAGGVGSPVDFTWTLKVPTLPGTYNLYARTHHGGGGTAYYMDFTSGLLFTVVPAVAGRPEINHQPPTGVQPGAQIVINAAVVNATIVNLTWKNTSMASSLTVTMTNTSTQSGHGWVYTATIPAQSGPTRIDYAINATGSGGSFVSTYTLSVTEPTTTTGFTQEEQIAWLLTLAAVMTIIAGIIAVCYMIFRQRIKKGT